MNFWTPQSVQRVTGGLWLQEPAQATSLAGVSIDSRTVKPTEVFVAIPGDRFDGHDFAPQAVAAGASMVIVDRSISNSHLPLPILRVRNTVAALAAMARAHRDTLDATGTKVIAVTGSNGKTTTRVLIHAILSSCFQGTQSPRSFNNHLGVPLTLLAANCAGARDRFLVVEIGTNHPGEIAALAQIVRPHCAVITNIGQAHIGHFGNSAAIGREKATLLRFVQPGGLAIVPGLSNDPASDTAAVPLGAEFLDEPLLKIGRALKIQCFGFAGDCDIWATQIRDEGNGRPLCFTVGDRMTVRLALRGVHNVANALAAIAVGRWAGIDDAQIAVALGHASGPPMRLETRRFGNPAQPITIINDAYNANPESVRAAIETLVQTPVACPHGRRVIVLGDMGELGDAAPRLHRTMGHLIAQHGPGFQGLSTARIHLAVFVGRLSISAADALVATWPHRSVCAFAEWDQGAVQAVVGLLEPGDVVLLKASRAMRLERIVDAVAMRFG